MDSDLFKECPYCGKKVPFEEIMLLKNGFICKVCYNQQKHKHPKYKKSLNKKEVILGIIFCVLGVALFLSAIWLWFMGIREGEGFIATAIAGGIIALAIGLLRIGFSAFF